MTAPPDPKEPPRQPATPIRVIIADDHPVVRSGIRDELARHGDVEVIGEAVDGEGALRLTQELRPDVLLLDIYMPGLKTVQVLRQLREIPEPPRVLILTAYGDRGNVLGMLRAGATGYLLKDEQPAVIAEAVRAVARGETRLSAAVAETLVEHVASESGSPEPEHAPTADLSARELEVLRLVARGHSNQQIAAGLGITERTVRFHMEHILARLGVNNRTEAVTVAIRRGWIEP